MIINTKKTISASDITDPLIFQNRRKIIKALIAASLTNSNIVSALADTTAPAWPNLPVNGLSASESLIPTPARLVQSYNNYYEFAVNKTDPARLAQKLSTDPWSVEIVGEVENPGTYYLEDLLRKQTLQEYIYRFRCVEGWSMVVPWVGFSLANLLKSFKPLSTAKYVKFTSVYRPSIMPKQRSRSMHDWPYVEGLRIDEAMHPLTILAVGMYGDILPKQNGAPLRLVVPWKYGFKSIKAVVKIELTESQPTTSWNQFAPQEYGFYANVNPSVSHPRWSQHSERPLGSAFFTPRRQTELFNGYGEQVASLYSNMDLRHFY